MFLLGMLNANIRVATKEKKSLTSDYYFEGLKICMPSFLIIYGIEKRKWKNICKYYVDHNISLIKHDLTGQKSNNAILFKTVLQILTFVTNYASVHRLLSPGIFLLNFLCMCFFIKFF